MVERQKIKAINAKCSRIIREISLSSKKKKNYENDTEDEKDLDKVNDKYSL